MRRLLTFFTALVLLLGSLAIGVLAADLPFWRRAAQLPLAADESYLPLTTIGAEVPAVSALPVTMAQQSDTAALEYAVRQARNAGSRALLVMRGDQPLLARYFGADDERTAKAVACLYEKLDAPVHVVPLAVAEMVKYSCNSFHGLKVAFGNEIGAICKALNVDSHEVMRIFCEDTKLNISPTYLRPGFAFGGSCLPKDLRALSYRARQLDVDTPVLSAALSSNEKQIARAYEMVRATGSKKVGVLGLAFKAGTDDLRESPIVTLVERLIGKGMQLAIYDSHVSKANLIGANREYIESEIPHIWTLMKGTVDEVVNFGEVVVIGNSAPEFRTIQPKLRDGQMVVDLVRAFGKKTSDETYQGVAW